MTRQYIPQDSRITRRTTLGILSGSLAALAGCSGGGDSGGGPPEEQSDYIAETSVEIVENGRQLALEVAVTDAIDPSLVSIITESGREFSSEIFASGETRTRLSLTEGEDSNEPLPRGQHTLYLSGDDVETEIPLQLGTSFEAKEVVSGTERSELLDGSLGVVIRNTGERTGAASQTLLNSEKRDEPFVPVEPGETGIVEFRFLLEDRASCIKVEETGQRDEQLTIRFLWDSSPIRLTQSIRYDTSEGCERTLAGEPEVATKTSMETET